MQEHCARTAVEALENDVAAIAGHSRPDPRFEKFFDLGHDFGLFALIGRLGFRGGFALEQRDTAGEVLHDGAENGGLQMPPIALALGYRNEIRAEKYAL